MKKRTWMDGWKQEEEKRRVRMDGWEQEDEGRELKIRNCNVEEGRKKGRKEVWTRQNRKSNQHCVALKRFD